MSTLRIMKPVKLAFATIVVSNLFSSVNCTAEEEAESSTKSKDRIVEEVIVTATKRSKSERDIPVSIDAFSGEDIIAKGGAGAQSVLLQSAGVSVNQYYSPSFVQIQIRGTTTSNVVAAGATPVGAFLGDIPLANPSIFGANPNIDAFDLASVEVLKGPQGTLFGGSALAGALRSIPNEANLDAVSARAFASKMEVKESEGDAKNFGLMMNIPLWSGLAIRGMSTSREYPGTVDDVRNGIQDTDSSESVQRRGMVKWEITDRFSFDAMVHDVDTDVRDMLYTDNPDRLERSSENGLSPTNGDVRVEQFSLQYDTDSFSVIGAIGNLVKQDRSSIAIDRVATRQQDGVETYSHQVAKSDADTAELRIQSIQPSDSNFAVLDGWEWLLGFFDYKSDQSAQGTLTIQTVPELLGLVGLEPIEVTALTNMVDAFAQERAIYFDLTRGVGERFELNLGGRLFRQEFSGSSVNNSLGIPVSSSSRESDTDGFNPKLAVTWHIRDDISIFSSATKGFRFGGVNIIVEPNEDIAPFYDSDELWNYEIGLRTDLFDQRLRFDFTTFYIDWTNIQISQRSPQGLSSFIENGGSAESKGAEVELKAVLPWNFFFQISGAYTDARTTKEFDSELGNIATGTRLPSTPYWTGSSNIEYMQDFGPIDMTVSLGWVYQGGAYNDLVYSREIPSYSLYSFNLSLAATEWFGSPQVSLGIANLTDERTYNNVLSPVNDVSDYFPIRPRSVLMQFQVGF